MPAGPCVSCGATDYPLSMGGPSICPRCDARPATWRDVREVEDRYGILEACWLGQEETIAALRRERDEARAALRDIAFGASADWAYLKELAAAALASIRAEGTT